ncbi:MAG: hypothetical protein ACR2FF_03415 [Mycobacteriales bacterium]
MPLEAGKPVDAAAFDAEVRSAVKATVCKQAEAGVDVLNDGEVSKPSYATYVKDRLTGFGGEGSPQSVVSQVGILNDFPDFAEQMAATMSQAADIRWTSCDGPVSFEGRDAVQADIANLKAALEGLSPEDTFMSSASPGVIAVFSPNHYYPTDGKYLEAIANAMREEYEAIHKAGFVLQLDCPDFAMIAPGAGSLENFRAKLELAVEALNHRGEHSCRRDADPRVLGQRRDAEDERRRAQRHHRSHPQGKAGRGHDHGVKRPPRA